MSIVMILNTLTFTILFVVIMRKKVCHKRLNLPLKKIAVTKALKILNNLDTP